MAIEIKANDVRDALSQLGGVSKRGEIQIYLRYADDSDYKRKRITGCIVDATRFGEEVERLFQDEKSALAYIARFLKVPAQKTGKKKAVK